MKRPNKAWRDWEIRILRRKIDDGWTCETVAKLLVRTTRSVQHKFAELGLKKRVAKIGDVIHGWKIVDIYIQNAGSQNIRIAKLESTISDKKAEARLTLMTNRQIGWPDRRRPDNTIRNTTHGMSKTRLYRIWAGMLNRCYNSKQPLFDTYGGRGIIVCEEWKVFLGFMTWAQQNGYSEELTLDRIDADGNYCPSNCRWSTYIEQAGNKRNTDKTTITAFGETKTINEWIRDARCVNITSIGLKYRIRAGWEPERAITQLSERIASTKSLSVWLQEKYPEIYKEYEQG